MLEILINIWILLTSIIGLMGILLVLFSSFFIIKFVGALLQTIIKEVKRNFK